MPLRLHGDKIVVNLIEMKGKKNSTKSQMKGKETNNLFNKNFEKVEIKVHSCKSMANLNVLWYI